MGNENPIDILRKSSGTYNGIYRAIVRDVEDPSNQGRVKVEVLPMLKGIAKADLPWAFPKWSFNRIQIPQEGMTVWVQFEEGNIYKPIYEGMASPIQKISEEVIENEKGKVQSHIDAANTASEAISGTAPSGVAKDRDIYWSANGIVIEYDDTEGAERITIAHPSGAGIQVDGSVINVKFGDAKITISESGVSVEASSMDVKADSIEMGEGAVALLTEKFANATYLNHMHQAGTLLISGTPGSPVVGVTGLPTPSSIPPDNITTILKGK